MYQSYNDLGTMTSNPHAGNRGATSIGDLVRQRREGVPSTQGTFASDEQLATLRDRLSGQPAQPAGSQPAAGKGGIGDLVRGVRDDREWREYREEPPAPRVNRYAAGTFSPSHRSKSVSSAPQPGSPLGGQFEDIPGKPKSDAMSIGRFAEDAGEDLLA
jgi:hypothetical protein